MGGCKEITDGKFMDAVGLPDPLPGSEETVDSDKKSSDGKFKDTAHHPGPLPGPDREATTSDDVVTFLRTSAP